MISHADHIRVHLSTWGPTKARQLIDKIGISQPTLSRTISTMGGDVVRVGAAQSIQYALRDARRGLNDIPIYRVGTDGKVKRLGVLIPVRPDGFVMQQDDGVTLHSDSLPWWLMDMRPQGFLGRSYATRHADMMGLPTSLSDWNDTHVLRALMAHGQDAMGNLLLGDVARDHFLDSPPPVPTLVSAKGDAYARLGEQAASGDISVSSAGGEQPKFTTFVETSDGPRHVLVKFTLPDANPVTERWRDLLLAEHHALETLAASGVRAAHSCVIDHAGQRFLEIERFDRIGATGRCGLFSLTSVEAEFNGNASAPWSVITAQLATDGHITRKSADGAALLYAFGTFIGNTDMHNGNLSFTSEHGRPYTLAPAYDMLPMGFAPRSGGGLPSRLSPVNLHSSVSNAVWSRASGLALDFLGRVRTDRRFSEGFHVCIESLAEHIEDACAKESRLG